MFRVAPTLFLGLFLCFPAFAADTSAKATHLDPAICRSLVKHTPDANVAYQPGVDVNGKPVAPADIGGGTQIQLPQTFQIPLTLGLAQALNLDTSKYPYNELGATSEVGLGTLTVSGDKVMFNGQPLSDMQQDNLAVLCMKPDGK